MDEKALHGVFTQLGHWPQSGPIDQAFGTNLGPNAWQCSMATHSLSHEDLRALGGNEEINARHDGFAFDFLGDVGDLPPPGGLQDVRESSLDLVRLGNRVGAAGDFVEVGRRVGNEVERAVRANLEDAADE